MIKKLNSNLVQVVDILNDGEYHDGTTVGEKLQMTRSAVWKTIKKLEANHIRIDSIKGKGYAMLEPLVLLDAQKIKKQITNQDIEISIFESVDSTNNYLKAAKQNSKIKICLTEQQTAGKGRLNREWYSPFGKNVYFSCQYPFQKDVSELSGLSLVTSLAVMHALKSFAIKDELFVKWPNDILYANKKLAGNLIEVQAETHGVCHAVIGIGVNVNMLADSANPISQAWTSMQQILNAYIDRNDFCIRLINSLLDYLQRFEANGFTSFVAEWMQADCLTNQTINVKNVNETITGKVTGITERGLLLLELEDGSTRILSSGDTSIIRNSK